MSGAACLVMGGGGGPRRGDGGLACCHPPGEKICIAYEDANGEGTHRVVWPLVLIYYIDAAMLVGWCELRDDLRHFRLDRVSACEFLSDSFEGAGDALISRWEATLKEDTVLTKDL